MKNETKQIVKNQCDITGRIEKRLRKKIENGIDRSLISKKFLYNLYWIFNFNMTEISQLFGYKSSESIRVRFKKYNIPVKSNRNCQNPIKFDKNNLYELYIIKGNSINEISKIYNCGDETIRRRLKLYNINRRPKHFQMAGWNKGLTKENNDIIAKYAKKISKSKLNGRSPAPKKYGKNWNSQRKLCLERDNHQCRQCGDSEQLHVHHWEPYRFCYDNRLTNLITLCQSCHVEIHNWYRKEGFIEEIENEYY